MWRPCILLASLVLLALALRLLIFSWHALYPLGGDESAFFEQARTFVQGRGYVDLELMRGPFYPLFLAVIFRLFGAEVSAARLAQVLLSVATVPLLYLWVRRRHGTAAGLVAAALGAAFFALSVQTTFLLTETLFLFLFVLGMVLLEWGVDRPAGSPFPSGEGDQGGRPEGRPLLRRVACWAPLAAGAVFGLAALTRSIGLPLVGVAVVGSIGGVMRARHASPSQRRPRFWAVVWPALLALAGAVLVILPWTVRNALVYHSFILVDTSGATNLWLDNDPLLGRDAVKRELLKYPEGQRQALALRNGVSAIAAHPAWFVDKCWQEVKAFFSLEYFDDFLDRPAIWYPPGEVWARVVLGDGLYLLLVAAGLVGLAASRTRNKVLDLLWLAFVLASSALFHVELRYRLPFLAALVPYAAVVLAQPRQTIALLRRKPLRAALAALGVFAFAGMLLAHANYPALSWQIAAKRVHVALGEAALARGDVQGAASQARAAIAVYEESADARVLLARALRAQGGVAEAEAVLRQAIAYRSGHPHPHLLLGDLLRTEGQLQEAAAELAYESRSLEDLQSWAWEIFATPVPAELTLGTELELGFVGGWHLPERTGEGIPFRWSDDRVVFRLALPAGQGPAQLMLRFSAGRPADLPLPVIELWAEGKLLGRFAVENGWHVYTVEVERPAGAILSFELRSQTFRPHQYDPHLDDNRALGVMVSWIRWANR